MRGRILIAVLLIVLLAVALYGQAKPGLSIEERLAAAEQGITKLVVEQAGDYPTFWALYSNAMKRIQEGDTETRLLKQKVEGLEKRIAELEAKR